MSRFGDLSADLITGMGSVLTDTTFLPGEPPVTLPTSSTAVGFVWISLTEADIQDKYLSHITAMVRVYPVQSEQFDGAVPIDPTPLYDAAANVEVAVAAGWQPADSSVWFYEIVNIAFDHINQYIEAELQATTLNDSINAANL